LAYQRTDLTAVRSTDIGQLKRKILGTDLAEQVELIVYGELMCNPARHDYQKRGLDSGQWPCFGGMIRLKRNCLSVSNAIGTTEITDDEILQEVGARLASKSYDYTLSPNGHIKILLCEQLRHVVEMHGGLTPEILCSGSVLNVVPKLYGMMHDCKQEGVVLAIQGHTLRKWKTAIEAQGSNLDILVHVKNRIVTECTDGNGSCLLIDPRVVRLIDQLIQVCTSPAAATQAPNTGITEKTKKIKGTNSIFADQQKEEALASALTKYDSIESLLQQGMSCQKIIMLLTHELVTDLVTSNMKIKRLHDQGGKLKSQIDREIKYVVSKYVGTQYSLHKKSSSGAAW